VRSIKAYSPSMLATGWREARERQDESDRDESDRVMRMKRGSHARKSMFRVLPPLLSFLVSYNRHFSSLDSVVTQTHEGFLQGTNRFHLTSTPLVTMHNAFGPGPGGTPSRGRSRCNWRRKPSCTSRRAYWRRRRESRAAVGAVGAVDAVCVLGAVPLYTSDSHRGFNIDPVATRRPRCKLFPEWPQWSACCHLDLSHSCPVSTPHAHHSSPTCNRVLTRTVQVPSRL